MATASARRRSSGGLATEPEFPGEEWGEERFILVTAPVQYLAEDSKLQLFNSSKAGLPGFCDPCPGEEKALYVLYRFKGLLHEVCVRDNSALTIPLMRDKLPEFATRIVNGQALVQSSSAPRFERPPSASSQGRT